MWIHDIRLFTVHYVFTVAARLLYADHLRQLFVSPL
jgi:hypothetical protein